MRHNRKSCSLYGGRCWCGLRSAELLSLDISANDAFILGVK